MPENTPQICVYYLFWCLMFILINVVWDIKTTKTLKFHIAAVGEKKDLIHPAGAFCSCLLVIVHVATKSGEALNAEMQIPFILAGISGILQAIPALCPYDYKAIRLAELNNRSP